MRYCACVLFLVSFLVGAAAAQPTVRLSAGAEYSSGDYGGSGDVRELYVPVRVGVDVDRFSASVTVPYLWVRAPSGTIITGPGGTPVYGSGSSRDESGIGDVVLAGTVRDVWHSQRGDTVVDLSGRIKLGTADENKGLGTGKTDYAVRGEVYRFLGPWTLLAAPGYRLRGDPSAFSLDNQWLFTTGVSRRVGNDTRIGLLYDFQTAAIDHADDVHELSLHLSQRLSGGWSVRGYTFAGLTDSSPDWGIGMAFEVKR